MSSSESSPPPPSELLQERKEKKKAGLKEKGKATEKEKAKGKQKVKDKSKPNRSNGTDVKNEGQDPCWAYEPPSGMSELDISNIDEDFDWDSLKDAEDKELWLFRIPDGFKAKYLDGLEFSISSNTEKSVKLTTFERKKSKLELWSVGEDDGDSEGLDSKGLELKSIACLLPRVKKKKGALYIAPKPIIHRLVVTHCPAVPSINEKDAPVPAVRESVPAEVLKHRFIPFGATGQQHKTDSMEVDASTLEQSSPSKSPSKSDSLDKASKKRKSKHDDTDLSPKKSKKLKSTAT